MGKECFRERNFGSAALERIEECNVIIDEYQEQGLRLTLRQLYYQFVSKDLIPNTERSYKSLGSLVSDGRLAGLIDWDAIEDRVRRPRAAADWASVKDLVDQACRQFRLPRWDGQEKYVELWVEKDALAGVLWPIAAKYHVTLMVNRGYSSQSAMYEAAQRFNSDGADRAEKVLLYLGDHDPSGEDMVRDVEDRLRMFGVDDLYVTKVALTIDQVRQYKPPPNPAKVTDSRAASYIAKFGPESWEVDALPPTALRRIIEAELADHVDQDRMDDVIEREEEAKTRLRKAVAKWKDL